MTPPSLQKWRETHREYYNAYQRAWRKKQYHSIWGQRGPTRTTRRKFIDWLKSGLPCAECGCRYHPCVMDFDHVRGTKDFTIAQRREHSWEKLQVEIQKCEVVCSNCHRMRTESRRAS